MAHKSEKYEYSKKEVALILGITVKEVVEAETSAIKKLSILLRGVDLYE